MPAVLVVDDRAVDRKLLTVILRGAGYRVIEASDGAAALRILRRKKAALIITDILMPTMDGYEFVRRLRDQPGRRAVPVIFYTATYHESEARGLADACGVAEILRKPSRADTILASVARALEAPGIRRGSARDRDAFNDQHVGVINQALLDRSEESRSARDRLAVIIERTVALTAETDLPAALKLACADARALAAAQFAVLGVLHEEGTAWETLYTSGFPPGVAGALEARLAVDRVIARAPDDLALSRQMNPSGRPEAIGLPPSHPPVHSSLVVPIRSASRHHGWLSLGNKVGMQAFTADDELAVRALADHVGAGFTRARVHRDQGLRLSTLEGERLVTSANIDVAQREERVRLSRTLHDQLGQSLTGLKMDISWLGRQMPATISRAQRRAIDRKIESMLAGVGDMLNSIRRIAFDLRPDILDNLGLLSAIQWQAREFERRSGIRCGVDISAHGIRLGPAESVWVFRVVQEALTNVLRHARAGRVRVSVRRARTWLVVSVVDNGAGVLEHQITSGRSLGFKGMRERATLLGGILQVRRRRPSGTSVTLRVPLGARRPARRS